MRLVGQQPGLHPAPPALHHHMQPGQLALVSVDVITLLERPSGNHVPVVLV